MNITDRPFDGPVHKAYTLAIISLLDLLHPELEVLEVVTNIAENIYEKVILGPENGPEGTAENAGPTGDRGESPEDSSGTSEND